MDRPCGEHDGLLGVVLPSLIRLVVAVASAVLALGLVPAQALAQHRHAVESNIQTRHASRSQHANRAAGHWLITRASGHATDVRLDGDLVLVRGAGYYGPHGSQLVRVLQLRLARAGDRPGPLDGRYGPLTEQGVRRFQAAHGLLVDGIAGPVTLAALASPTPVLYPGAGLAQTQGSAIVRDLQWQLASLGLSPGPVDGRYGPLTTDAVQRFQRAHRLVADGIVGPRTGRALRAALRRRAEQAKRPRGHPMHKRHGIPASRVARVPRAAHLSRPLPELPVTLVLLGMAVLGLGTAAVSYRRTRPNVQRARASTLARGQREMPPSPRAKQRTLVAASVNSDEVREQTPENASDNSDEERRG